MGLLKHAMIYVVYRSVAKTWLVKKYFLGTNVESNDLLAEFQHLAVHFCSSLFIILMINY